MVVQIETPGEDGASFEAAASKRDENIVENCHMSEQLSRLICPRDALLCDRMRSDPRNVCFSQPDDTAVRAIEAAHEVEHRALPGSIRSNDARDIARARIEAEVVYRTDSTEVHGQVACTKAASGAGGQVSHHIPPLCCYWAPPTFFDQVCCQSDEATGR